MKDEFALPKDMKALTIDFQEVRIFDAQFKRRKIVWSGQEVLDLSLNIAKSKKILK